MKKEFDYYVITPTNLKHSPKLMEDFGAYDSLDYLYMSEQAPFQHISFLKFNFLDAPKSDLNTDYLDLYGFGVFSDKVKEELDKYLPIKGFEWVTAIIRGKKKDIFDGFSIANIYLKLNCFDEKLSVFDKINDSTGEWEGIKKVVLNKEALSKIPLSERLCIRAKENFTFQLYHKSIVNIINSVNPHGLKFIPVEDWYTGINPYIDDATRQRMTHYVRK